MKIAYDHQIFTFQSYGGISRYHFQLATHLIAIEEQIAIFAPFHFNEYITHLPANTVHGQKISEPPRCLFSGLEALNNTLARTSLRAWNPDILHLTYYPQKTFKKNSFPVVLTIHDMIHEIYPHMFSASDRTSENKKRAIQQADHIICISESTRSDLEACIDIKDKPVTVIHHGYDKPLPSVTSNSDISSFGQDRNPYVLFVGQRKGYKNFSLFLEAMASSEKLHKDFDIIAFGGGKLTRSEESLIAKLKFNTGQVRQESGSDSLLAHLYTHAESFVYPTLYEGFGLPLLEAMTYQCPVIASNTSSIPEIAGKAAEYFNPESVSSIRSAIEHVVYSSQRRHQLSVAGRERIMEFSWERCALETQAVYQSLV